MGDAGVVELEYTADLNPAAKACRFETCRRHQREVGGIGIRSGLRNHRLRHDGFESLTSHQFGSLFSPVADTAWKAVGTARYGVQLVSDPPRTGNPRGLGRGFENRWCRKAWASSAPPVRQIGNVNQGGPWHCFESRWRFYGRGDRHFGIPPFGKYSRQGCLAGLLNQARLSGRRDRAPSFPPYCPA